MSKEGIIGLEITMTVTIIEEEDVNVEEEDGFSEVVEEEVLEGEVEGADMEGFLRTQGVYEDRVLRVINHINTSTMETVPQSHEDTLWETRKEGLFLQWLRNIHLLKMIKDTITTRVLEVEEENQNHPLREEVKTYFPPEHQELHLQDDPLPGHTHALHQDMIDLIIVNPPKYILVAHGLEAEVVADQDWQVRLSSIHVSRRKLYLSLTKALKWIALGFLLQVILWKPK